MEGKLLLVVVLVGLGQLYGQPISSWVGEYSAFGGYGNNPTNEHYGAADQPLLRHASPEYKDYAQIPRGGGWSADIEASVSSYLPSPRKISNAIHDQPSTTGDDLDSRGLTSVWWQWGQFVDHDIDLTFDSEERVEEFNIPVPTGDEFGVSELAFHRSLWDKYSGSEEKPRTQMNGITSYIDASNIYGTDATRAKALRARDDTNNPGELLVDVTNGVEHLPLNTRVGVTSAGDGAYAAGDFRVNEQGILTAMHDLWVREHNRYARSLKARHPSLTSDEIYNQVRMRIIYIVQRITYQEWLPALLGSNDHPKLQLDEWDHFRDDVNPAIMNEFSTVAFRLGHSLIRNEYLMVDANNATGVYSPGSTVNLKDLFFQQDAITGAGTLPTNTEKMLRSVIGSRAAKIDTQIVDALRNELFATQADLASLNIQRGRDHGIPSYNALRHAFGLEEKHDFLEINPGAPDLMANLSRVYGDDISLVDPWVGGLAEEHVGGASVGELFGAILVRQFQRLADGDRFHYQNDDIWGDVADEKQPNGFGGNTKLKNTKFHHVLRRNGVLLYNDGVSKNVFKCKNNAINPIIAGQNVVDTCPI